MEVRALADAQPFTTADGSTIRELLNRGSGAGDARNQSLAEASLGPGGSTQRHYHREAEEIYFLLEGDAELELDGERRPVGPGDAILIPPGAWHEISAGGEGVRFLCCCAPPYRHDDTFFE
ncbi:MAG TPA: cupin domain-containing protein [Gaiellaceae bacterium]|jgi:mannose-6-phosphate isomerase-like protein (cupin superfamily)|nr:cupin domain-containing protein [Gaiellaceae bacterium]